MKFISYSNELFRSLKDILYVLNRTNKLKKFPILENFLFKIKEKNVLTITVSDLEITMTISLNINSINFGSAVIPHKILLEILKKIPEQPLTFCKEKENKLKILSHNGEYDFSIFSSEEYQKSSLLRNNNQKSSLLRNNNHFLISEKILLNIINNTLFAVGNDEIRPVLNGVFFDIENNISNFVSTNSNFLVKYSIKDFSFNKEIRLIIPKKPLNILKYNLNDTNNNVYISYNDLNTYFLFKTKKMRCSIINGNYPNYKSLMNKKYNKILIINKNYFLNAIKRVTLFSNRLTYQIILNFSKKRSQISSFDINYNNKAFEYLFCNYDGEPLEIVFNSKYLIEILSNINCEEIKFEMLNKNYSCRITPLMKNSKKEEILILIMPLSK
ncbi:MAG: DNA polymerase III subunit beta [Candidatus Karelsulcia muelleri]